MKFEARGGLLLLAYPPIKMRNNHKQCNNISTILQIYNLNKCIFYGVYWVSAGVTINWNMHGICCFNVSKSISPSVVRRVIAHCTVSSFRFNAIKIIIFQNVSRKPETPSARMRMKNTEREKETTLMAAWKKNGENFRWTKKKKKNERKTVCVREVKRKKKKFRIPTRSESKKVNKSILKCLITPSLTATSAKWIIGSLRLILPFLRISRKCC